MWIQPPSHLFCLRARENAHSVFFFFLSLCSAASQPVGSRHARSSVHVSWAIAVDAVDDDDVGLASITEIAYLKRREKVATTNGKEMNEWREEDVTHILISWKRGKCVSAFGVK